MFTNRLNFYEEWMPSTIEFSKIAKSFTNHQIQHKSYTVLFFIFYFWPRMKLFNIKKLKKIKMTFSRKKKQNIIREPIIQHCRSVQNLSGHAILKHLQWLKVPSFFFFFFGQVPQFEPVANFQWHDNGRHDIMAGSDGLPDGRSLTGRAATVTLCYPHKRLVEVVRGNLVWIFPLWENGPAEFSALVFSQSNTMKYVCNADKLEYS